MINLETALAADDLPLVPLGAYAVAARVGAASCALATDGAGRWWYRNFAPTAQRSGGPYDTALDALDAGLRALGVAIMAPRLTAAQAQALIAQERAAARPYGGR